LSVSPLRRRRLSLFLLLAIVTVCASLSVDALGHWRSGQRPDASGYTAMVYLAVVLQLELVVGLVVITLYTLARLAAGRLDRLRRATFDNLSLLWQYTVCQGLIGLLLVHGFPRFIG